MAIVFFVRNVASLNNREIPQQAKHTGGKIQMLKLNSITTKPDKPQFEYRYTNINPYNAWLSMQNAKSTIKILRPSEKVRNFKAAAISFDIRNSPA